MQDAPPRIRATEGAASSAYGAAIRTQSPEQSVEADRTARSARLAAAVLLPRRATGGAASPTRRRSVELADRAGRVSAPVRGPSLAEPSPASPESDGQRRGNGHSRAD